MGNPLDQKVRQLGERLDELEYDLGQVHAAPDILSEKAGTLQALAKSCESVAAACASLANIKRLGFESLFD